MAHLRKVLFAMLEDLCLISELTLGRESRDFCKLSSDPPHVFLLKFKLKGLNMLQEQINSKKFMICVTLKT